MGGAERFNPAQEGLVESRILDPQIGIKPHGFLLRLGDGVLSLRVQTWRQGEDS